MNNSLLIASMALVMLASCKHQPRQDEGTAAAGSVESACVAYQVLRPQLFHQQLICNGRLRALRRSDMSFADGGVVTAIYVTNGSRVAAGQVVARSDASNAWSAIGKAERDLERAKIELTDKLIGLGYKGITDNVPPDVLRRARVSTGWFQAAYALADARRQLARCVLRAPFAGRVADLTTLRNQPMDKICTIVDDRVMRVEFDVLEAELKNIHRGQRVLVTPFTGGATSTGTVVNINPMVSDRGLIRVTATVPNTGGRMLDGENVRIVVESDVANCFVVPKDAVVERDGYHVLFTYHDGEAVWTYVDIAHSNATQHAVTGCKAKETELHTGDTVITSGNMNLADGTAVKLRK